MFNAFCILIVGLLASYASKEYKLVSVLMFLEFMGHEIAAQFGLIETRLLNPVLIYLVYMIIQASVLGTMFTFQLHPILALFIFINLAYNFCVTLQHIGVFLYWIDGTFINFHKSWKLMANLIMSLEVLYLLGINTYVRNYTRKYKLLDIDYIDNLFCIRRRIFNGDMA